MKQTYIFDWRQSPR